MKKETLRSCSAWKRIKSEYCRLKGSFTENRHGRVEITHGRVPVAENIQRRYTGVWKLHMAMYWSQRSLQRRYTSVWKLHTAMWKFKIIRYTSSFQIYSNSRVTWACGNSTRPCGCPFLCLFKADFRSYSIVFGGDFPGLVPNFEGATARVSERLGGSSPCEFEGFLWCFLCLVLIFPRHCIAPLGAKPLVGSWTCEP